MRYTCYSEGTVVSNTNGQYVYLVALLRMGDLDIREIAKNYLALRLVDYYRTVEKFVNRIPMAKETLEKIASLRAAEYDYRTLQDICKFLEDIGDSHFAEEIAGIAKSGKIGHTRFAADSAKSLLEEFAAFCEKISAVHKVHGAKPVVHAADANNTAQEEDRSQLLKDALHQLDTEEATRRFRILSVDDSPVELKIIHSELSADYDVYGMANPAMVENFLHRLIPDLFLLDYKMPEISGFDLVPIIRSFPEHQHTPIIFLTAMGTPDNVTGALNLGACDYLVKPFHGDGLREKVAKHIGKRHISA